MHCIVGATTHNENIEDRVEYAIFEITPVLIEKIKGLQAATALVQENFEQPQALTVLDSTPVFFDPCYYFDEEAEIHNYLETEVADGFKIVNLDEIPAFADQLEQSATRVDVPVMKMFGMWQDSIKWCGYIKHCGVTFETELIPIAELTAFVDTEEEKHTCLALHGSGPCSAEVKEFDTKAELKAYKDGVDDSAGWLEGWCVDPEENGRFDLDENEVAGLSQNYSDKELASMGIVTALESEVA